MRTPENYGRVLDLIAQGHSLPAIANELQVSLATIYRWRQTPEFKRMAVEHRAAFLHDIATDLAGMGRDAVRKLRKLVEGALPADNVTLRAVGLVLEHVTKLIELADHETRIADLEAKYAESHNAVE